MDDENADEVGETRPDKMFKGTLRPLFLDIEQLSDKSPTLLDYANNLRAALDERRTERVSFYNDKRADYRFVLHLRSWLAVLGGAGILLTAAATAARFGYPDSGADQGFLIAAMLCYAGMAGISFFERSLNLSSSYFRQLSVLLAMRDIWTKFQFELLAELRAAAAGGAAVEVSARDRIAALAKATWSDMEALTLGEQEGWQGEVLASLKDLATAAESGRSGVETRLAEMEKAAAAAETARTEREAAAARATMPALLTLMIEGAFSGAVDVLVDEEPVATANSPQVALKPRAPGVVHVSASAKNAGGVPLKGALNLDLKPGIQNAKLVLA